MKYFHILKTLYTQPVLMTKETFQTCHQLVQSRIDIKTNWLNKKKVVALEDDAMPEDEEDGEEYEVIDGVAYINIVGVIGKKVGMLEKACGVCDVEDIKANVQAAELDTNVHTLLFCVDSGGGGVSGVPELAAYIAGVKKKKVCFVDGMCCSAAYYLIASCSEIYATETSQVGSIGVYSYLMDDSIAYQKEGLQPKLVKAGNNKGELLPGLPITDEMIENVQKEVDMLYNKFTSFVSSHRSIDIDNMQGRAYYSEEAEEFGFVDGIVNFIDEITFE